VAFEDQKGLFAKALACGEMNIVFVEFWAADVRILQSREGWQDGATPTAELLIRFSKRSQGGRSIASGKPDLGEAELAKSPAFASRHLSGSG
jgi:hypothetical protein